MILIFYHVSFQFSEHLSAVMSDRTLEKPFNLIIYVESAIGLLNLPDVCRRAAVLQQRGGIFSLAGVVFGSDDFVADIGRYLCFKLTMTSAVN